MINGLVRDYENTSLSIEKRLASLARRFKCLKKASGLNPWDEGEFIKWVEKQEKNCAAANAGIFILALLDKNKSRNFDVISALSTWNEDDKALFATWVRSWNA